MPDYMVRFKAHLIPFLKPECLPNPILHDCFWTCENFEELKNNVNKEAYSFILQNGFITLQESKKPMVENAETLDLRCFVPLHMVSHITHEIKKMVTDVPNLEDEGIKLQ